MSIDRFRTGSGHIEIPMRQPLDAGPSIQAQAILDYAKRWSIEEPPQGVGAALEDVLGKTMRDGIRIIISVPRYFPSEDKTAIADVAVIMLYEPEVDFQKIGIYLRNVPTTDLVSFFELTEDVGTSKENAYLLSVINPRLYRESIASFGALADCFTYPQPGTVLTRRSKQWQVDHVHDLPPSQISINKFLFDVAKHLSLEVLDPIS